MVLVVKKKKKNKKKNLPANAGDVTDMVRSIGGEDPLKEGMATHSSILACRIPWTEKAGGLQSIGSQRVRHDKQLSRHTQHTCMQLVCISSFI